jgi:hypothetical protein
MEYTLVEVGRVRRRGSNLAGASKGRELHPLFGDVSPHTQPILLSLPIPATFSNHAFGRLLSNIRIYRPEVLSAVLVLGFSFELVDMELCDFKRRDFGLLARLGIEL